MYSLKRGIEDVNSGKSWEESSVASKCLHLSLAMDPEQSGRLEKEGPLTKEGSLVKNLKSRHFCLFSAPDNSACHLIYYENSEVRPAASFPSIHLRRTCG